MLTGADLSVRIWWRPWFATVRWSVHLFFTVRSIPGVWLDDAAADVRGQFQVVAGDIRDLQFVRSTVRECEIVLHLAALISIPFSDPSVSTFIDTNVTGTLNILQASRDCNVARVVCTSTSEVYGSARYLPIDENHPLQAQSPYAASKIACRPAQRSRFIDHSGPLLPCCGHLIPTDRGSPHVQLFLPSSLRSQMACGKWSLVRCIQRVIFLS